MDEVKRLSQEPIRSLGELPLVSVDPSESVLEAVRRMQEDRSGCVLVCEDHGRPVGILTERDVLRRLGTAQPLDVEISQAMSRSLWPVQWDDSIGKALRIMKDRQCRHLPVVAADGTAVGILSVKRIVHALVEHFPSSVYNLPPSANQVAQAPDGA